MHTMHAMKIENHLENILDKANLAFPDDIVLLEPDVLAKRLREKARIDKHYVPETMSKLFASAIRSERLAETIPPGLTDIAVFYFKILTTARLVNSISSAPSIKTIAEFTKLSRNLVSPCVKFLESIDLVTTKLHVRHQLAIPTRLTTLYVDVISSNLENECNRLREVANEAKQVKLSNESLEFLEDLETVFHIAKLAYKQATVNYEIMDDLHNRIRALVVKAREGNGAEVKKSLDELLDLFEHITGVRERAKRMGIRPVVLEETEEKLGRARVFRVK